MSFDPDLMHDGAEEQQQEPIGDGQFSIFRNFWPIRSEGTVSENPYCPIAEECTSDLTSLRPTPPSATEDATTTANGEFWNSKTFLFLFSYLTTDDLKVCRLVCRKWREKVNPVMKSRSAVVINGDLVGGFFTDGSVEKCIKYLGNSVSKFSLWKTLRLTHVRDKQMKTLLASRDFQIAVKSILELQLDRCEISWNTLLKIFKQFINLQIFLDKKTRYTDTKSSSVISSLAIWSTSTHPTAPIESNFVKKDICLEDLKCLKIYKADAGPNTTDLIKILTVTTVDLEELHLKLDPQNPVATIKDIFEFERHFNILFFLNARSLRKLYVDMMDTDHIEYFNDFLKIFRDWSGPLAGADFAMEEMILKFKYVWLSKAFEMILIPYVSKLRRLKVLGIGSISFKPEAAYLLDSLLRVLPQDCSYEFGLFVTDHPHRDDAEIATASRALGSSILKSDVYRLHMTDVLIGIFHDDVERIGDLVPSEDVEGLRYEKTLDVCIFTEGPYRPNFKCFDIKLLCCLFSNVTNLEIIDGPYDNYFKSVFKKSSEACIGDEDFQCILRHMLKLEKLIIFANMETLTDSGVTGLPAMLSYRMRATKQYRLDPMEIQGYRFGNLKNLKYLSLRGIGTSLTDVSAYWGFSNVKKLKTLIIANYKKLSPEGRQYLQEMYPASRGCFVAIL